MSSFVRSCAWTVVVGGLAHLASTASLAGTLPIVDLGYELQKATLYDSMGAYYNFSNIRYAAPPTGKLRFRTPRKPRKNRSSIQTGHPDRVCAQARPAWYNIANQFVPAYIGGQKVFNQSSFNVTPGPPPPLDPRTTEDCLFLDVLVPRNIFENSGKGEGAPVLVWIYGGGYTEGSKSGSGNPAGLLAASSGKRGEKIVVWNKVRLRDAY